MDEQKIQLIGTILIMLTIVFIGSALANTIQARLKQKEYIRKIKQEIRKEIKTEEGKWKRKRDWKK